jgi:lipopolysaccharide transport system ATP-binding protein
MSVVIQVDRLSKQYRLGTIGGKRLADDLNRWWAKLRGKEDPLSKVGYVDAQPSSQSLDRIWALKDVSFEVRRGEVLGLIGRNGAGKSTLLKILSRVTAPSSGEARVKGRIASLLEVGTGFHPELTGRENIFLNGAILGMTRAEIRAKFDEIVEFAEISKFIDTPVKRYSSGMYVRLAFAVAAHLEPEILIVDEVLAVGDAAFQKKCLGKMQDVAGHGRTVVFVSHNMGAIMNLCPRSLLLASGCLHLEGASPAVVKTYLCPPAEGGLTDVGSRKDRTGAGGVRIVDLNIHSGSESGPTVAATGSSVGIVLCVDNHSEVSRVSAHIGVYNLEGQKLLHLDNLSTATPLEFGRGRHRLRCELPRLPLPEGSYSLNVAVVAASGVLLDRVESACRLEVVNGDFFQTGVVPNLNGAKLLSDNRWSVLPPDTASQSL